MTENIRVTPGQGNSIFLRNSGDFELTEFEIAGFDCIISFDGINHLVVKSSFKPRTEVFSFFIIGETFRTNKLLWIRLAFAYLFLVCDT